MDKLSKAEVQNEAFDLGYQSCLHDRENFTWNAAEEFQAYKNTGLAPAEITQMAKAKADGRLIMPCKVGDIVFSLWSRVDSKKQYIRRATITVSNLNYYLSRIQDGRTFVSRHEAQVALDRLDGQK